MSGRDASTSAVFCAGLACHAVRALHVVTMNFGDLYKKARLSLNRAYQGFAIQVGFHRLKPRKSPRH